MTKARPTLVEENHCSVSEQVVLQRNSLGVILGMFKSASTKRLHLQGIYTSKSVWQRNNYDHIIRNEEDYLRILEYIQTNPVNWEKDEEFFPSHPSRLLTI